MILLRSLFLIQIVCTVFFANTFYRDISDEISVFESEPLTIPATMAQMLGNATNPSFSRAKRILQQKIYDPTGKTVYCDCDYYTEEGKLRVRHEGCGFLPLKPGGTERDKKVEWEHVVPASHLGKHNENLRKIWDEGHPDCVTGSGKVYKGRQCLEKVSLEFRLMQADMYNLYPAIGSVNGYRSDRQMGEIPGEEYVFGTCNAEFAKGMFEPRDEFMGDVARTYLYMQAVYPDFYAIPEETEALLKNWSIKDPVDALECSRQKKIYLEQGNPNPILRPLCDSLTHAESEPVSPILTDSEVHPPRFQSLELNP
jgi:deoxyribonuclease-1